MVNSKVARRQRIRYRIRKKIRGTAACPRLAVYKSNQYIYAQLIDDDKGRTLAAASSVGLGGKSINLDRARQTGALIATQAHEKGIKQIVFDRSGYPYHGRVKALAEGAKEKGIKF